MNYFLKYEPNVIPRPQKAMEQEDKVLDTEATAKASERTDKKLLKELIKNVERFITNKELRALSETLKKIFYHGLSLDSHVSCTTTP